MKPKALRKLYKGMLIKERKRFAKSSIQIRAIYYYGRGVIPKDAHILFPVGLIRDMREIAQSYGCLTMIERNNEGVSCSLFYDRLMVKFGFRWDEWRTMRARNNILKHLVIRHCRALNSDERVGLR